MLESKYNSGTAKMGSAALSREAVWGDMHVILECYPAGLETASIFRGLPGDACQSPHWGYIVKGRLRVLYQDHEEVLSGGDAYFMPPGHTLVVEEDTELVEFSPRSEHLKTQEVTMRSVASLRGALA